ncbi:Uncharacterized protein ALO62_01279 [Pseudomonas amygdali pv. myricae]|uniref:hypothetical protein n=1 Tax=Pseudomonas amygdali TaxID=47877 RepID=UPI0006B8DDF8|nr:hypothetical protein [Pseudomonas amygdali]KPX92057.1 Uncharacterized protein ALO62_01279 [Pseudomonas amygdali pv. myricae]KWS49341.1 hypothetical protein AL057_26060 [Pseudomonas amygdali pv. myricae]RMT52919.1 hypothetical protein ALP46_03978 [Pseudomonas amygdali pv. myricae]RMV02203.1 hypothetical protein ALP18_00350 [Pseudomonas amygdali pv. myricae]RMV21701.1 hypothetical protein ALP14_02717 [Pseudomonas amygdali pv. myricae]
MRIISSGLPVILQRPDESRASLNDKIPSLSLSGKSVDRGSTVSISGDALLRQRLYNITDSHRAAPMLGRNLCGKNLQDIAFLNRDDRRLLGSVYEWAQDQGADLTYVDALGLSLARYRENDDGRICMRANQGKTRDGEGYTIYQRFTDRDAATAERILQSEAYKTTRLDQKFIGYLTDKDYSALSHPDFNFLEQVINRFSAKGEDQQLPLSGDFSRYTYIKNNFIETRSGERRKPDNDDRHKTGIPAQKTTKPKEITLESLREDMRNSLMKAMGIKNFSSLFDVLFKNRR